MLLYYQVNYTLTAVPEDTGYFHAQFRRVNPLPYKDVYTILDGVGGHGHRDIGGEALGHGRHLRVGRVRPHFVDACGGRVNQLP